MDKFKRFSLFFTCVLLLTLLQPAARPVLAQDHGITEVGSWSKGPAGGFICLGDAAYMAAGATLQTWNIADAANPILTSEIAYPMVIEHLELYGDWLVGSAGRSLITLDLSDPLNPLEGSTFVLFHDSVAMCISDGFAFLLSDYGDLDAFDLVDPSNIVQADSGGFYGSDFENLACGGGMAYASTQGGSGFFALDITDPYNFGQSDEFMCMELIDYDGILVVGGVIHLFTSSSGWIIGEIDGDELVPASVVSENAPSVHHYADGEMAALEDGIIKIYDFSTPDVPVLVDTIDPALTEGLGRMRYSGDNFIFKSYSDVISVFNGTTETGSDFSFPDLISRGGLYENYYITCNSNTPRLNFFDITDPANIPDPLTMDLPDGATFIYVSGGYAIATNFSEGAYIVDLSTGPPFSVRDVVTTDDASRQAGIHEGFLYLSTASDDRLKTYDLSIAGSPQEVATIVTPDYANDMIFYNDFLLFLTWNTLMAYDVSTPGYPALVSTLQVSGHSFRELTVADGIIYLTTGSGDDGIDLVEIGTDGELSYLANHDPGEMLTGIRSMDNRLYGYAGSYGMTAFDVSNPMDIQTIFNQPMISPAGDLDIWGWNIVVCNYMTGFTVFQDVVVTPVHMSTLGATRVRGGAQVDWTVFSEIDDAAFHIWRGESEWDRICKTEYPLSGMTNFTWFDPAPPSTTTNYWLEETRTAGSSFWYGPVNLAAMVLPKRAVLHEPCPNPFNPIVALRVELPEATQLLVTIHDLRGRHLATLSNELAEAGDLILKWNGCNESGQAMPAGAYFARMATKNELSVQKLMLVR